MGVKWTAEQQAAIDGRGCNLLVSAAAGSGKTAVLVERIIGRVLDAAHPVDIDRMLVVTFTKAAAAEMRERVAKAIEARMDEEPDNAYLHRQYTLVHHAQITTIDSFCLYVVKNYFQCIGLEPGFRVGDPAELSLIMTDVLSEVLERWYEEGTEEFLAFADDYASAKSDAAIADMVRRLYDYSQSYPWSREWLMELCRPYEPGMLTEETLAQSESWLAALMDYIRSVIGGERDRLLLARRLCLDADGPEMYLENIEYLIGQLEGVLAAGDYDAIGAGLAGMDYGRLTVKRNFPGNKDVQELVKSLRMQVKKELEKLHKKFFAVPLVVQLADLLAVGKSVKVLSKLTLSFADAYRAKKEELALLDFSDIEHMALRILIDEETKEPTGVAREFQALFEEVMIDEYQDSNYVQEAILSAVAGKNNRFMVGDVKQSIYRFRLARPELFMEKYDTYAADAGADCRKICLHQNFRSRAQVLESVNDLFYRIMKRDVGGVDYDEEAALRVGADFAQREDLSYTTRLLLADADPEALDESGADSARSLEAALIAEEIRHVMQSQNISDGAGGFRPVRYSDIVILLRSPGSWGDELTGQLAARGIPSHRMSQTGYFSASEVQTVLALCQVIDNPLQDIPLAALLKSLFFSFTSEELARIRVFSEQFFFYDCVKLYAESSGEEPLREKTAHFLEVLAGFRERARHMSVHDLLDGILRETGYLNLVRALPAGEKRLANVEMLLNQAVSFERTSYKGLFSFIRYMQQLQKYEVDFGEADVTGEGEDVVRIMSIHKSKGLEFPIVFVSGLGRKFNRKDSTDAMILDSTFGVGLSLVERQKHRKRTTLFREMIAARIAGDNIGEELRVLYVALTRAKEQLIMTGTLKGMDEALARYELASEQDASFLDRREAGCYLDWILPGAYAHPLNVRIETYEAGDFELMDTLQRAEQYVEKEQLLEELSAVDGTIYEAIDERLRAAYPYEAEVSMQTKLSVSEIKRRSMLVEPGDEEALAWYAREEQTESYVPLFVRNGKDAEVCAGADGRQQTDAEICAKTDGGQQTDTKVSADADGGWQEDVKVCVGVDAGKQADMEIHADAENGQQTDAAVCAGVNGGQQMDTEVRVGTNGRGQEDTQLCTDMDSQQHDDSRRGQPVGYAAHQPRPHHGALRGTAMHRFMECIDYGALSESRTYRETARQLEELLAQGRIGEETAALVDRKKVWRFLQSGLAGRIMQAHNSGKLYREQPFVMGLPARETDPNVDSDELVLVQGIIDLYFEEDGGLVLLDYKTDAVKEAKQLLDRYQTQMDLYARALAAARGVPVKEKLIYSFRLGEVIEA